LRLFFRGAVSAAAILASVSLVSFPGLHEYEHALRGMSQIKSSQVTFIYNTFKNNQSASKHNNRKNQFNNV